MAIQFAKFFESARPKFAFLVREFGFAEPSEEQAGVEAWLSYSSDLVIVNITYEFGSALYVMLKRKNPNDAVEINRMSLELYLSIVGKTGPASEGKVDGLSVPQFEALLDEKAGALKRELPRALRGDFRVFNGLREAVEANRRAQQDEMDKMIRRARSQ